MSSGSTALLNGRTLPTGRISVCRANGTNAAGMLKTGHCDGGGTTGICGAKPVPLPWLGIVNSALADMATRFPSAAQASSQDTFLPAEGFDTSNVNGSRRARWNRPVTCRKTRPGDLLRMAAVNKLNANPPWSPPNPHHDESRSISAPGVEASWILARRTFASKVVMAPSLGCRPHSWQWHK